MVVKDALIQHLELDSRVVLNILCDQIVRGIRLGEMAQRLAPLSGSPRPAALLIPPRLTNQID